MQRDGAARLHLLALEPRRRSLPAGIALSGLLHVAVLALRPPLPIEPLTPQPLRATSFVVDVIDRPTSAALAAPPAQRLQPPALPPPRQAPPRLAAAPPSRAAVVMPTPRQTASSVPATSAPVSAEPSAPALPLSPPANDTAASRLDAGAGVTGSARPAAAGAGRVPSGQPAPVVASDPGQARASRARYLSALTARIRQHRQYPYLARRQGIEGTVCLRLSLDAHGELIALRVTCGGESEALVEAARTAVTEAAPFEPLPADLGTSLAVEVPIVFRLEEG